MVGNISLWLSTAEGTMTFYCVAHRLQILESPTSDSRFFYVCRKVIFNMLFSKAERLPNEAPHCEECFGYLIHYQMMTQN